MFNYSGSNIQYTIKKNIGKISRHLTFGKELFYQTITHGPLLLNNVYPFRSISPLL